MKKYRKRIYDTLLDYRLEETGAVVIEGPKWCGKTTTAEQKAKSILYMNDPDSISKIWNLQKFNQNCYFKEKILVLLMNGN